MRFRTDIEKGQTGETVLLLLVDDYGNLHPMLGKYLKDDLAPVLNKWIDDDGFKIKPERIKAWASFYYPATVTELGGL